MITYDNLQYNTITSSTTGRVWLDRNIGATSIAHATDYRHSYGEYFTQEDAAAINFPGFRLPTVNELLAEQITDNTDALRKLLLPSAGYHHSSGDFRDCKSSYGLIWSSSVDATTPNTLGFGLCDAYEHYYDLDNRLSVRLIKDSTIKFYL